MTWIESRMADLKAMADRRANIREYSSAVYEALWKEINEHLTDATKHGLIVVTNGAHRKRIIKLQKQNKPGQFFEMEFNLVDSKDRIRAVGDRVSLSIDFDICPDGIVCLKIGNEQISVEQAAIRILDPFLFPQLQPVTPPAEPTGASPFA